MDNKSIRNNMFLCENIFKIHLVDMGLLFLQHKITHMHALKNSGIRKRVISYTRIILSACSWGADTKL